MKVNITWLYQRSRYDELSWTQGSTNWTTLLQDGKALCWVRWDARRGLVHLFIRALRDAGGTCPLPGSFSKQKHSGGRKSHINRKFTTYFTMTSFMSDGCMCRARTGSALGCWCVCCCSLWPGDITLIWPVLVSQDASAWSQPIRSQKRKRSIDTSKRKKPSQASLRNRIEEEGWDLQETEGSDSGDEGSVRSDSLSRTEEQKGLRSSWLTVGFLSHSASVFGHVDPDPSPYGAHLLASVTQKGLKLLWCAGEWAQSHAAFTCKQKFTDYSSDESRNRPWSTVSVESSTSVHIVNCVVVLWLWTLLD